MNYIERLESDRLRVGKILAIGRNYVKHAEEMGAEARKDFPVVFLKPATAIIHGGEEIVPPSGDHELHYELELAAVIGRRMKDVDEETAVAGILGCAVGLDMTLRDVQSQAKEKGEPWSIAKGFDTSAPLGVMVRRESFPSWREADMELRVNGEVKQSANTRDMIFPVERLVSYLSRYFTLEPGDVVLTGTPEGVGRVVSGDTLEATVDGLPPLSVTVR